MESILKKIISAKKKEVSVSKKKIPLPALIRNISKLQLLCRDFKKSISSGKEINIIGELKIASPVKGYLRQGLNLVKTALLYKRCGISAISILTDSHFKGKLADIKKVKSKVKLPILRKDFIIDEYQIFESRAAGADAILLIAAILDKDKLKRFSKLAFCLGLDVLIEIHTSSDINKLDKGNGFIIGINNRNLKNFKVDIKTTERLINKIPKGNVIVSESGISSRNDMIYLKENGVQAVLIGEGIVSAPDMGLKIKQLLGKCL